MSFEIERFCIFSGNSKSKMTFQICGYKSNDLINDVLKDGYFNKVKDKLTVNNIIQFLSLSDGKMYFLKVYQIHLNSGVKTEIIMNSGESSSSATTSDVYSEISSYGKKYAKIKELINKNDAAEFVISCEYKTLNLGAISYNGAFSINMRNKYNQLYSQIESLTDDQLTTLEIDFSDIVNAEIERINNL